MADTSPKQDGKAVHSEETSAQTDAETPEERATLPDQKSPHGKTLPTEVGGPKGLEPTRYGDWERNGRCSDF